MRFGDRADDLLFDLAALDDDQVGDAAQQVSNTLAAICTPVRRSVRQ